MRLFATRPLSELRCSPSSLRPVPPVSITSTAVVIPAAGRMEIQVSPRRNKFENLVPTLTFRIFQHLTTPVIIAHVMQPSVAPV